MTLEEKTQTPFALKALAPGTPFQVASSPGLFLKTTDSTSTTAVQLTTGELYDMPLDSKVIPRHDIIMMATYIPKLIEVTP